MQQLAGKAFFLTGRFPGTTHAELRARIEAAGGSVIGRGGAPAFDDVLEFAVVGSNPSLERLAEIEGFVQHISLAQLERMLGAHVDVDREALAGGLMSLGIVDGDETVLDLATGAQFDRLPIALTQLPALAAEEVTVDALAEAMAAARLSATRLSDLELGVDIYDDSAVLRLEPSRHWLRFQKAFTINPFVGEGVKHSVVNSLNASWDTARFLIAAPDTLVADWGMPYHQGLAPFQVVLMLQGFVATVQEALRTCEDVGLLA